MPEEFGRRLLVLEQTVDTHSQRLAAVEGRKAPVERPTAGASYTVKKGDSLSTIGRRYGVSTAALVRENSLASADKIRIGQRLAIPGGAAPPSSDPSPPPPATPPSVEVAVSPASLSTHEVQKGETLYSIARRHQVSVRELQAYNGISDPRLVWGGQILRIPGGAAPAQVASASNRSTTAPGYSAPTYRESAVANGSKEGGHTVVRGETLTTIARAHGVSVRALQEANGITDPRSLRIGQSLKIPGGTASAPATEVVSAPVAPQGAAPAPKPAPAPAKQNLRNLGDRDYVGYSVIPGDTVESIASLLGTDASLLREINDVPPGKQVPAGEQILVPASAVFGS